MYQIVIKPTARKDLKRVPISMSGVIIKKIDSLSIDPRPEGCKKLVNNKQELWRVRVGDYRILYAINDTVQIIDIHYVGHRRDIYR
jgi:mRNA interferase RelE/StbE